MKIRSGFVSNSSSSSYIVLLPKNFDPKKFVDNLSDDELTDGYETYERKVVEDIVKEFYDDGYAGEEDGHYLLSYFLDDFIIASVEGSSGYGSIVMVNDKNRERIKELLNKEMRYDKLKNIEDENS